MSPTFVGRVDELQELGTEPVVAVTGLPGLGKTQLAARYARDCAQRGDFVAWVNAWDEGTLIRDLAAVAERLDVLPVDRDDQATAAARARDRLEAMQGWLCVVDDASDPALVEQWCPRDGGRLLITSESDDWLGFAEHILRLEPLKMPEAVELLARRSGRSDAAGAAALAERLGRVPLALEQAAAYVARPGQSYDRYLRLIEDRALPSPVASTWGIALDALRATDEGAARLLGVTAFFAPEAIPLSLVASISWSDGALEGLADPRPLDGALEALGRYSLVTYAGDALVLHRLVQDVLHDRLTEPERRLWSRVALTALDRSFPMYADDLANADRWPETDRLLPHLLAACDRADAADAVITARLLMRAGAYLHQRGRLDASEAQLRKALALAAGDEETEAQVSNTLGYLLQRRCQNEEAATLHARALEIIRPRLRGWQGDAGSTLTNLGKALFAQDQIEPALACLEEGLELNRAGRSDTDPEVATTLNALGQVYVETRRPRAARKLHDRAIEIKEASSRVGPRHQTTAWTRVYRARALAAAGDHAAALADLKIALEILQERLGDDHGDTTDVAAELTATER